MTRMEAWVTEMVKIVVGEMGQDSARQSYLQEWSDLERRAAVLLIQARALECRTLAGELLIADPNAIHNRVIAAKCNDRSHRLEAFAMKLAQPEGWPIKDEPKIIVPEGSLTQ